MDNDIYPEIHYEDLLLTCRSWYWISQIVHFVVFIGMGIILIVKLKDQLTRRSFLFLIFIMALILAFFMVQTWQFWWEDAYHDDMKTRKCAT